MTPPQPRRAVDLAPAWRAARFAALAVAVAAALAATGAATSWLNVWQAESFGDRRLAAPRPDECAVVRRVLADALAHHRDALTQAAHGDRRQLELQGFAWRSQGQRVPPGVDWRDCPGFGRDVRRLGLQPLGVPGLGPSIYISRPLTPPAPGQPTDVRVTLFAPQTTNPVETGRNWTGATTWQVTLPPAGAADATPKWLETTALPPPLRPQRG